VKALDRKLLRDLRLMWSQALTIALVVATGIGGFIASLSAIDSLALARDRLYASGRFADVFASVKRAPNSLTEALRGVPGVADVQTTLEQYVRVTIPGVSDPIVGQLIGVDPRHPLRMNRLTLSSGRGLDDGGAPRADDSLQVLVSEAFAQVRGLKPGSRLTALINGRQRTLVVVGTALSPEFVFAGLWGMPDIRDFGIFWVDHDALAAAYDMRGAFNRLAVKLAPGASEAAVAEGLAHWLGPYGGREAHGRADQVSHSMLEDEIKSQRAIGVTLPAIFLGVAAFLLNVVITRLVSTQREQIAALKALGYPDPAIGAHYLKLVLLIVAGGLALGVFVGDRLGTFYTGLYAEFYRFPSFEHRIAPWLLLASAGVTVATAVVGTLTAILATVRLAPAEAMRPPSPGRYRRTLLETLGIERMGAGLRMIVRNMERRLLRTGLSVVGIATAVAIVILGGFFRDAIDAVLDTQFNLSLRGDVTVWMNDPVDDSVRYELARLPGVRGVEATRFVAVRFSHGPLRHRSLIRGYAPRAELYRVIDADQRHVLLDGRGLLMTDRLAHKLDLHVGEPVQVEVLEGKARTFTLVLGGTVHETMGLSAYLDRPTLNRLLGDGDVGGGYVLAVEPGREPDLLEATREMPRVAGAFSKATMRRNMEEISARNVRISSIIMTVFAVVIAVGVVYNNARIALAERGWELASLRVLGFTRAEVSALLLGELAILIALALPLGIALGFALTHGLTALLQSDLFAFPAVVSASNCAWAVLTVVGAGIASALVVRQRIDRLDMVAVLKTRD
jgi:putative ABC transport system permease protein